ncbi:MAG: hypothetical protein ACLFTK_02610 [Anaerolineales bacterium]
MPVDIQVHEEENIIIATYTGHVDAYQDVPPVMEAVSRHYEPNGRKVYYISDFREADIDFSGVVVGMAEGTRPVEGRWYVGAPNSETILVGTHAMLKLVQDSIKTDQYGNVELPMFKTLDEALAHVRQGR